MPASVIEPGQPSRILFPKTQPLAPRESGKRFVISLCMKTFNHAEHLKRVHALQDEIDLVRRLCDCARTDAVKRRQRRRVPPRRRR